MRSLVKRSTPRPVRALRARLSLGIVDPFLVRAPEQFVRHQDRHDSVLDEAGVSAPCRSPDGSPWARRPSARGRARRDRRHALEQPLTAAEEPVGTRLNSIRPIRRCPRCQGRCYPPPRGWERPPSGFDSSRGGGCRATLPSGGGRQPSLPALLGSVHTQIRLRAAAPRAAPAKAFSPPRTSCSSLPGFGVEATITKRLTSAPPRLAPSPALSAPCELEMCHLWRGTVARERAHADRRRMPSNSRSPWPRSVGTRLISISSTSWDPRRTRRATSRS